MNEQLIELKVRLHRIEDGLCREIWEIQQEKGLSRRYLSRATRGFHEWMTLSNSYLEPIEALTSNIVVIICDRNWNELAREGNDPSLFPNTYPTLNKLCKKHWNIIKPQYPDVTYDGFSDWILDWSVERLYNADEDNWIHFWNTTETIEILHKFDYLGEKYVITRQTKKHTRCDAVWFEYYAGKENMGKYESYAMFYGFEYNKMNK